TAGWLHWDVYTALIVGDRLEAFRDRMDPSVVEAVERGRRASALDLKNVELVRTRHWEALRPVLHAFDALLCPTTSIPAMPIGTFESSYGHVDGDGKFHHFEMTFPFNMLSPLPALTVPSGLTKRGLPTGLQIVGRRHADQ